MWAIGADNVSPDDILVHYNGTTWRQVTSTALAGLQFRSILALSDTNVWVTATVGGSLPDHLLHFNGKAWASQPVPAGVQLNSIAPDGHGGLWFSAARLKSSQPPLAEHRSATGTWSSHALPTGTGLVSGIAPIPGTTSLWAAGYLETNGGTCSDAVIWRDGGVFDLQSLLDPLTGAGWTITSAAALNNLGQIVGTGTYQGAVAVFVMTPVAWVSRRLREADAAPSRAPSPR